MSEETSTQSTLAKLMRSYNPVGYYSSAGQSGSHQAKSDLDPRQIMWGVKPLSTGMIEATPLIDRLPAPATMRLGKKSSRDSFVTQYWPEPEVYVREAMDLVAADSQKKEIQLYPETVMETVKAYLPMVLVYLASRQRAKAETIMDFMLAHNVPMCDKQKRLLNRVAMELRREKRYDAALECLVSVRKYYGEDENLHFNIARIMWDTKRYEKCEKHLVQSLAINPELAVARRFLTELRKVLAKRKPATPLSPISAA